MPVTTEFIRAWRAWQRAPAPYSGKYVSRQSVATGKVEHDLDHMETDLYYVGLAALEGKNYQFAEVAGQGLRELARINSEIEGAEVAESEKALFRNHIGIVRAVWLAIEKLGLHGGAIQQ